MLLVGASHELLGCDSSLKTQLHQNVSLILCCSSNGRYVGISRIVDARNEEVGINTYIQARLGFW